METNSGIKVVFGAIVFDGWQDSFKDGLKQVQLRQTVTKHYPEARIGSNLGGQLFSAEELGIKTTEYTEDRLDWVEVSKKATEKQVMAKLAEFPNARIYKILSHEPILTDSHKNVLVNGLSGDAFEDFKTKHGLKNKDSWDKECSALLLKNIADRQTVRYGEGNDAGEDADSPILYNGKVQYKETVFHAEGVNGAPMPDIDLRIVPETKQDTPDIELAKVGTGVNAQA